MLHVSSQGMSIKIKILDVHDQPWRASNSFHLMLFEYLVLQRVKVDSNWLPGDQTWLIRTATVDGKFLLKKVQVVSDRGDNLRLCSVVTYLCIPNKKLSYGPGKLVFFFYVGHIGSLRPQHKYFMLKLFACCSKLANTFTSCNFFFITNLWNVMTGKSVIT